MELVSAWTAYLEALQGRQSAATPWCSELVAELAAAESEQLIPEC